MKKSLLVMSLLSAFGALSAPVAMAEDAPAVTGNFSIVSDYRFRGISQTKNAPTVQGGIDYSHSSGVYVGTWGSGVSSNQYAGGSGMEWDIYGGWKGEVAKGLTLDAGYLYYYYPKADYKFVPGSTVSKKYDNQELYLGLSAFGFTAKINYALADYFGVNGTTAAYSNGQPNPNTVAALNANTSSKGTTYYSLAYRGEIAPKLTLNAGVGYTQYAKFKEYSYTDYKLGLSYDLSGWALGAAVIGTSGLGNVGKNFNTLALTNGTNNSTEYTKLYKPTLVLSVGKTF